MARTKLPMTVVLVAVIVAGMTVPAAGTAGPTANDRNDSIAVGLAAADGTNGSSVNVTVGQQLSTVVATTSDEVQTDFEDAAFEVTYESANESDRAEVVAERAEALRERAARVNEDYREVTAAYRTGELDESAYAQRIALLNARAKNILRSHERLRDRAENVSALDLRAAGVNRTALNRSVATLDVVTGGGPSAILERYTGRTDGELEIEVDDGLTVAVESEDGDRSLEVERSRDGDDSMTVTQSVALTSAREAIPPAPDNGTWTLTRGSVHADSGYYRFEFALRAANASGETEVRVDGSSGSVFRLEQEVESADERGDADRESDEDDAETEDDRELALVVADGTPAPNATITVKALSGGEPAANTTVYVDDRAVGTTGNAGTVTLTLPEEGVTVEAVRDDREAELEFEFEDREDDVFRRLNVSGSVDDGGVTVSILYEGAPVPGATVYADGDRVGTTGADGTVTFATTASEELEVEVVKGEFEAELTFAVSGDTLSLAEELHEGDGDRTEGEDERESDEEEDEREEDEDDETTTEEDEDEVEGTTTEENDDEDETTEADDEDDETTTEDDEDDEDDETTTEKDEDDETTTEEE